VDSSRKTKIRLERKSIQTAVLRNEMFTSVGP